MIFPHFIHSLSVMGLLYFAIADGHSMPLRLLAVTILLTSLSTVSISRFLRKPFLCNRSIPNTHWLYGLASACFFFSGYMIFLSSPPQGIQLEWKDQHEESMQSILLRQNRFELLPAQLPKEVRELKPEPLILSGMFELDEPLHAWLLFTSHGDAVWKLDGETIAELSHESNIRSVFSYTDIPAGIHHLSCEITGYDIVPAVSARVSVGANKDLVVLQGPFVTSLENGGLQLLSLKNHAKWVFYASGLFALVPLLNAWVFSTFALAARYTGILHTTLWIITLFALWHKQSTFLHDPAFLQLEADESAFGLMSQQLLHGQSPPLFHYGQNYQGTFESVILSFLQNLNLPPEQALKVLPTLWFVLFIGITAVTFRQFGSKALALFSCVMFLFMGFHFHWLFHKAWFGYSFSMVCGAVMWYAALYSLKYGLRPGTALLWGLFAGLSLYELPISISFVITTFFLILYSVWQDNVLDGIVWKKRIISALFHKSMLILYISSAVFLSPYLLATVIEGKSDTLSFLLKGRELATPKETGEHPFINRFLEECFPVLTGTRLPYDQQSFPDEITFPFLPSMLLVIGFLSFLILCRKMKTFHPSGSAVASPSLSLLHNNQGIIFTHPAAPVAVFIFVALTVWIGCYSPFGIWPWYFSAVYWAAPVLLYPLFSVGIEHTPGFTAAITVLFLFTQMQSYSLFDARAFQPLSLSAAGLVVPTNFYEIVKTLQEQDVKFVIADQGYDYSSGDAGRDWVGETLSYQSGMQVISFDSHSRRLPDQAQLLMRANRVAYLFHEDFFYQNPVPGDTNYTAISMNKLNKLFGVDFLDYQRFTFSPYILFIPPKIIPSKNDIHVDTDYPYFMEPMLDQNTGIRSSSARAYWSSGMIPPKGVTITFTFDKARTLDRLILFHGPKANDYPWKNEVKGITPAGEEIYIGQLEYDPTALASHLNYACTDVFQSVQIFVYPNDGGYWLTIYEAWVW